MKKILLFMSAATMFAAISCNKVEVNSPQTQTPSVNHTHESIEFVAYTEVDTKTTLNGYATEWEEGDEIDINDVVYRAQESGNKSVFTIVAPEAEVPEAPYHAGYPSTYVYDNNENIEGKLAFIFSNEHTLNDGEICEDVLAVAYSESEPSLYFKNVVSLLKFQAPEFTEDITEIRISTSEPLAGCVYVDYINATWTPDESEETFNEVILTANSGKFEAGKTYYVPVLPGGKTNLTVYINGYHAATVKEFECERSVIHNIGTLPTPKASKWGVKGSFDSWGDGKLLYEDPNGNIVAKKVALSGPFKIVNADNKYVRAISNSPSLSKWLTLYDAAGDMSLNGTYDVYVNVANKAICVVSVNSDAPSYELSNRELYVSVQSGWGWPYLYGWEGSNTEVWGGWQSRKYDLSLTISNTGYYCWKVPANFNNKTVSLISSKSGEQAPTLSNVKLAQDRFYELKYTNKVEFNEVAAPTF